MTDATANSAQNVDASTSRVQLAEKVAELRGQGRLQREIADELGISRSYASELCHDPLGLKTKARKDSYRQPCPRCETLMDGSNGGNGHGPKLCTTCRHKHEHETRVWTQESIIEAIRYFAAVEGRPPVASEFTGALATVYRRDADTRTAVGFPDVGAVQREFGAWSAALEAAGFTARRPGDKPRGFVIPPGRPRRFDYAEALRLNEAGMTGVELARRFGVHRKTMYQALETARRERPRVA